jgi:hypothetical protein
MVLKGEYHVFNSSSVSVVIRLDNIGTVGRLPVGVKRPEWLWSRLDSNWYRMLFPPGVGGGGGGFVNPPDL